MLCSTQPLLYLHCTLSNDSVIPIFKLTYDFDAESALLLSAVMNAPMTCVCVLSTEDLRCSSRARLAIARNSAWAFLAFFSGKFKVGC